MTDFGGKLYDAVDKVIKLYDSYGMASDIMLAEEAIVKVINKYTDIEKKLVRWEETKSLKLASEICEDLIDERTNN